jgi:hypothetical protein
MNDKPSTPPEPERKESPASPPPARPKGVTQPLKEKPVSLLDPETEERLKKILSDRKQSRQGAGPAKKDEATPAASTPVPPEKKESTTPQGAKTPVWPEPAKSLDTSQPQSSQSPTDGATPATGTERLNRPSSDPASPGRTGLLSRVKEDVKPDLKPEGKRDVKAGMAANLTTQATRKVPKGQLAQKHWKVIFQAIAGSEIKPVGVEVKGLIVIGRLEAGSDTKPDLDLTPYGAGQMGVSRQHVILFLTDDGPCVIDLNSTNGTWINGLYLEPGQKYQLRTGDRLELGSLKMLVRVTNPADQDVSASSDTTDSKGAARPKPKPG